MADHRYTWIDKRLDEDASPILDDEDDLAKNPGL